MKTNVELNPEIVNAVYQDIVSKYNITNEEVYNYITNASNIYKQSREEYILTYYETIILKDNKSDSVNIEDIDSVNIEDIDKVNFEELTETDKKVIESRKYMYNEYVKEIFYKLNELINRDLSNNRRAVDEAGVVMYAIQAIERDVANAVSDCQKVLKLMKSKCS